MKFAGPVFVLILLTDFAAAQIVGAQLDSVVKTKKMIEEVARQSFPEIKLHKIRVKTFESRKSFFKARYSVWRYATFQRMRHLVFVNPGAFERKLPEQAFRSIVAHELAHVSYYTRKNRFELLGLLRLMNSEAEAGFERKADLEAIARGYGEGLIEYRDWLNEQLTKVESAKKSRTYFTSEEIRLVIRALAEKPGLMERWKRDVPRDIEEIKNDMGYG